MTSKKDSELDWPETVSRAGEAFRFLPRARGGIKGQNFITPDLLGLFAAGRGVIAEVCTGHGFEGDRIFAVTFRDAKGDHIAGDTASGMYPTLSACARAITDYGKEG